MRGWISLGVVIAAGCGRVGFDESERLEYIPPDANETVVAEYVTAVLSDNPIAYYRLESTTSADDSSTFARHAELRGSVSLAAGIVGNAVRFTGGEATTGLPDGADLVPPVAFLFTGRSPFSYECWLKPDLIDGMWRQLTQTDNWDTMVRRQGYTIEYRDDDISIDRRRDDADEVAVAWDVLVAGKWSHIVTTYDGANLAIYVDGTVRDSQPSTFSLISPPGTPLTLSDARYTVTGLLDECAIYDTALSAGRIAKHYETAIAR